MALKADRLALTLCISLHNQIKTSGITWAFMIPSKKRCDAHTSLDPYTGMMQGSLQNTEPKLLSIGGLSNVHHEIPTVCNTTERT